MKKDPLVFIKHIRDFIDDIESYVRNKTKSQFLKNKMMQDAIVRKIGVIGQAVKNLPASFTNKYPAVPWSDIAGMRDKLIHYYFGVDLDKVWDVIKQDIPELKKQIKEILKAEE
jgi:uncharacterized protein with HEPN domain